MNRIAPSSRVNVVLLGHVDLAYERPAAHEREQNRWREHQYRCRLDLQVAASPDPEAAELAIARRIRRGDLVLAEARSHWALRASAQVPVYLGEFCAAPSLVDELQQRRAGGAR